MYEPKEQELLLDGNRGIYIPQAFAQSFDRESWHISEEDHAILLEGPEHEEYWDTWAEVLNNAHYEDDNGKVWQLDQEDDLWAVYYDEEDDEEDAS